MRRSPLLVLVAVALTAMFAAGCGGGGSKGTEKSSARQTDIGGTADPGGPVAWPAPPADQVATLATKARVALENRETLIHHVHAHLDVFIDGEHRTVPSGVGIVITDPAVHTGTAAGAPAYGGINGCDQPCISPLHTHDVTGVIHTESASAADNTLGQFFQVWDVRLDASCVGTYCTPATPIAVYVNGQSKPLAEAASIPLSNQTEIAVVIGRAPSRIPATGDFTAA